MHWAKQLLARPWPAPKLSFALQLGQFCPYKFLVVATLAFRSISQQFFLVGKIRLLSVLFPQLAPVDASHRHALKFFYKGVPAHLSSSLSLHPFDNHPYTIFSANTLTPTTPFFFFFYQHHILPRTNSTSVQWPVLSKLPVCSFAHLHCFIPRSRL